MSVAAAAIIAAGSIGASAMAGSSNVQQTSTPNIGPTAQQTLASQQATAPGQLALAQQYAPQYQNLLNNLSQQGLFGSTPDYNAYGQAHPDLLANYQADPGYASMYGSLNNYLAADAQAQGRTLPTTGGQLSQLQQSAPQFQALQSGLNQQQAGSNISLVNQYGGAATQAFQNANPQLQAVQGGLTNLATSQQNPVSQNSFANWAPGYNQQVNNTTQGFNQQVGQTLGQNQVGGAGQTINQLNDVAQRQLALGGSVSQQQASQLSGQILANYNQAGRANDPTAIAGLATGLDSYSNQLLQQREQNAASAGNLQQNANQAGQIANLGGALSGLGLQNQANTSGLGLQGTALQAGAGQGLQNVGLNQNAQLSNANYQLGAYGSAGNLLSQTSVNPFAAILGQSGAIGTSGAASGASGASSTAANAQNQFNPYNISTGLYNTQLNANSAANINTANNNLTTQMGLLNGLFGSGSFICWVARECYGAENPQWLKFRDWLLTSAPRWFRWLYVRYGAKFALFIHDKPKVKALIRSWMDARIANFEGA